MTIQERLKADLTLAIKNREEDRKHALRVIMGELSRGASKQLDDNAVVPILKKLIKSEKELLEKKGTAEPSEFIRVVEAYLPDMASEAEIRAWIESSIDFGQYKTRMQAMGPIMKHFGTRADGNLVKAVLGAMGDQ